MRRHDTYPVVEVTNPVIIGRASATVRFFFLVLAKSKGAISFGRLPWIQPEATFIAVSHVDVRACRK